MITFVLLAAVLALGAAALVAIPLLKGAQPDAQPAPWAALSAGAVVLVGSAVLYLSLSNWSWRAEAAPDSPQTMVARLARRLERDPQDLNGWLMLGQSYTVLRQFPLAARAYRRANQLAGGQNSEALLGEAEALALADDTELDRRAGRLVEQALALKPDSGKALFFGAAVAMRRGDLPLARDRFAKLLTLNPPDSIKPLLQQQIAAIDRKLAGLPDETPPGAGAVARAGTPSGAGPANMPGGGGGASGAAAGGGAATASTAQASTLARVRINVVLGPKLSAQADAAAPLFVFVRDPAQPGPPLAVKRLESHFPQIVELTGADSMMPGRALSVGQKVQVVARIARSGNPVGASGDPFGEIAYQVGRDGQLDIVIDHITP